MTRTRLTAEERHGQLIGAALTAFTAGGYAGTTTDQVARLAGVSQPYVIRLFGTKQQLFIATVEHAADRIERRFRAASPDLAGLGDAYDELLAERELITVMLHGFAAGADPAIGPVVRACFARLYATVRELTGADAEQTRDFFASGMLLTVLGAMNVIGPGAVPPDDRMKDLVDSLDLPASLRGPEKFGS
ncbi:TetR/AcrR family transcriptional regulator [Amorphoplanes digitatis]|uniref:AcrR family transcriptional regulator n=1 Tax=Actinoplanes digitatis TaxID=1868 RepID=A0A7W7HYA8_9ACTN|nr:TetR/AcrR family transcriptional regulator [Actinoplanes digitatis]MBB4762888.1 AcrR family transcriptional regulator [Actinoplanes digitatis]BFE71833.1 TetR family transcriptional regulator [Actinoplanes digitatis]GID91617.1 TetR family transcriptional regulator [Actinoplanes digitatis]